MATVTSAVDDTVTNYNTTLSIAAATDYQLQNLGPGDIHIAITLTTTPGLTDGHILKRYDWFNLNRVAAEEVYLWSELPNARVALSEGVK